jgi:Tol biopolymer transport system component
LHPGGKWLVYTDEQSGVGIGYVFKVSVDGGTPIEVAQGTNFSPIVSPDGKLIAYGKTPGQGTQHKVEGCGAEARRRIYREGN